MEISIIIPFHNEAENAEGVIQEIQSLHPEAEIIAVDDGSQDQTHEILIRQKGIQLITLPQRAGQSAALYHGMTAARGDILVLIDGDGQTSIPDIEKLLSYIPEYDFVNGHRATRMDSWSRRMASRFANQTRQRILHDGVKDTGGSPKILKRECLPYLAPLDGMHRFIPAMLVHAGFRIREVSVSHRPRLAGRNKYGLWPRAVRGSLDLLGMRWFLRRRFGDLRGNGIRTTATGRRDQNEMKREKNQRLN
jgi:dolichol-phosphate mannosyltransferase